MADPFHGRGKSASGEIVKVKPLLISKPDPDEGPDIGWIDRPIVRFTTSTGRSIETATRKSCTVDTDLRPGTKVELIYDSADPRQVCLARSMVAYRLGNRTAGIGFALLGLLAAGLILFMREDP